MGDRSKLEVWDFKAGPTEKIGRRDTHVVHFRLGTKGDRDSATVSVWIDDNTLTPLKLAMQPNRFERVFIETYHEFVLDPKIDAKAFEGAK